MSIFNAHHMAKSTQTSSEMMYNYLKFPFI